MLQHIASAGIAVTSELEATISTIKEFYGRVPRAVITDNSTEVQVLMRASFGWVGSSIGPYGIDTLRHKFTYRLSKLERGTGLTIDLTCGYLFINGLKRTWAKRLLDDEVSKLSTYLSEKGIERLL